jgi:hypothetical protein
MGLLLKPQSLSIFGMILRAAIWGVLAVHLPDGYRGISAVRLINDWRRLPYAFRHTATSICLVDF